MYKVSLLVETEGLSMHQLSKVFLITLASFSLVGLAGCADKKSATAPATEKASSPARVHEVQRTNVTTIALATYHLMKSNGQLEKLNDDIEPSARNVVEDTDNKKIAFDAGTEQNDYFEQKAHITIDSNKVLYTTKQDNTSVDSLYKKYSKTVSFQRFLDEFEIQDHDEDFDD